MDNRPIGVFDSGLGGLTVVRQLMRRLPYENIVYFGDTGRVPYGTRSRETIEKYTKQDCRFLLSENVKMIIAACGTVSSVAPHILQQLPIPAIGVVEPAAAAAAAASKNGRIGVIGTAATIQSGSFRKAMEALRGNIRVFEQACPLFVPLVENGWIDRQDEVTRLTAKRYMQPLMEQGIDTLLLGCTHFPLLSPILGDILGSGVTLIDAGQAAADACVAQLRQNGALNNKETDGEYRFFVSDRPQDFSWVAGMFLGCEVSEDIHLLRIETVDVPDASNG